MALKQRFLEIFLAACLVLCYTTAQAPTTPQNSYGCQNVTCLANQVCRMIQVQCFSAPCDPQPSCVDSAPVCDPDPCVGMMCLYGRATDDKGCIMCGCVQPCDGVTCPDGYECEPTTDAATKTHIGQCVATVTRPQCAIFNCDSSINCRFGFKLDNDGCQMGCQCYDPCESYSCPDNKRCLMSADDCPKGAECRDSPMPYCADISDLSSTPTSSDSRPTDAPVCYPEYCTLNCSNGRVTDENGCLRCQCRVCPEDPCAGMICLYGKARDGDGCIICGCIEPCSGFHCPEGQECHPTLNTATNTTVGQCFLTVTRPPCQKVTCGPNVCPYGFQSDVNGCQTCECRDPCKGHQCQVNQRCVVSADDCPAGAECRDAPMPYCVDLSTATLPPTPQLSTTLGRGERGDGDGQETVRQCCSSVGMSDACLTVCSTNITLLYSNLETLSGCFQYLGAFLHCASGGRSHINCCSKRGISESCLYLCSGNDSFDISNPHAVTQCVISSSQTVLGCFNEGLTDVNMTVPQTSTPSSTTAEDICSLAPDAGKCRAIKERWYYSAVDRACATFNYGGCDGNGNNFLTRDDCLARCSRGGSVCPDVQCPSSCQITVDEYGCHSCYGCGDDCMTNGCPQGQDCRMIPGTCTNGTNCPLVPACIGRPDVICYGMSNCTLSCPTGWMTDSTGCAICQCKSCPPACEGMVCLYGRAKGRDGCDTCDCYNPCQTLSCPDQCRVMKTNVTGIYYGECYSMSTHASTPVSRPQKPLLCLSAPDYGMSCQSNSTRWFYDQSANACSSFSFGGCQGNDNNFQTKPICEAMCKDSTCPQLDCRSIQNCPYGMMTDDNGCSICQCLDPCQGMECPGNTVCVSRKSDCADSAACRDPFTRTCVDPTLTVSPSTAAPSSTTTRNGCPPTCRMYCSHGFEKDSNGCDTCICQDPCKNCTAAQTCVRMAIDCPVNDQLCAKSSIGHCVDKSTLASSQTPTSAAVTSPTPASSTSPVRCLLCMMHCPYLMMKGPNGCPVCHCYEPCQGVNCNGNTTCQVFEADCSADPECPPNVRFRGQCVDVTTTASTTPSTTGPGRISCPARQLCPISCPYGNGKDSNGCYTCDCDDPCLRVTCNSTQTCKRVTAPGYCEGDMCWMAYDAICIPKCTRQISCDSMNCTYGLAKGPDDCDICQCIDPCQGVSCAANEECTVRMSMPPTGHCTRRCPSMMDCKISCEFGYVKDSSGCKTCECYDPCQNQTCPMGETCVPDKNPPVYSGQIPAQVYLSRCMVCQGTMMCKMACPYSYARNMTTECYVCQCYEPCQNVTCPSGQVCMPKQQFDGRYQFVAECADTTTTTPVSTKSAISGQSTTEGVVCGPVCLMDCPYGMVRDANGCPTCNCNSDPCASVLCPANQQCLASQLQNGSYYGQCIDITSRTPIPTKPSTSGPSHADASTQAPITMKQATIGPTTAGVTCGPVCQMSCPYGMVRDANGCQTCKCNSDPCAGVSCRTSQTCVASLLQDGSYSRQCTDCPMPMCMSPCFYGTKPDAITGCPSCECRMDPCSMARCTTDLTCQALLFCPDSVCTPSPVCVDRFRPCDGLEKAYEKTFGNNLGMMPQMNCDSRGLFQPIQCSDYDCWCVDEFGTPTSNRSSMQLNCYSGNQTVETLKIEADINVITLGEGWRFKQQVSHQLSNMLGIDESLVTVRKYVKGSIMATVVIGSTANTDMISVQQKLNLAKQAPFSITYDNQTYQAILLGGPVTTTDYVTPLVTPESTVGPTAYVTPASTDSAGGNLLMIILICVFVPVGLVAIALTIWIAYKILTDGPVNNPRRLSEKSGASSEIHSLESGSNKSYSSDTFSSTITKDEKVPVDTTEA